MTATNKTKVVFMITPCLYANTNLYARIHSKLFCLQHGTTTNSYDFEYHEFYKNTKKIINTLNSYDFRKAFDEDFLKDHLLTKNEIKMYDRGNTFICSLIKNRIDERSKMPDTIHYIYGLDSYEVVSDLVNTTEFNELFDHAIIIINDFNNIEKAGFSTFLHQMYEMEYAYQVVCENINDVDVAAENIYSILDNVFNKKIGSSSISKMLPDLLPSHIRIEEYDKNDSMAISSIRSDIRNISDKLESTCKYDSLENYFRKKIDYMFSAILGPEEERDDNTLSYEYFLYVTDIVGMLKVFG